MNLHTLFLTENPCYNRNVQVADNRYATFQQRGPLGIVVHSTGAKNPKIRRYVQPDDGLLGDNPNDNDWNKPGMEVCVHAFIGQLDDGSIATYQTLPWTFRGWHCGGDANNTHVGIEICEDDTEDPAYFAATYQEILELAAYLCRMYGFDPLAPGVIIDHSEGAKLGVASGHVDVGHWWGKHGKTMDDFRQGVAKAVAALAVTEAQVRRIASDAAQTAVATLMAGTGSGDTHHNYAAEAIQWAKDTGLIKGLGNGDYAWAKPVTREELVTILYRYHNRVAASAANGIE